MGKIFRRTLTALLIVILALSAAIVGAAIKPYTATGEDYANEVESQDIAKLRARDKAIKKATKQAGVYLKTYSRSVNSELTDDEVTAITSNAWQLVGEPKYSSKIVTGSDETSIIIWTATVEVNVDDSEIQSWIKRDDKDKSTIITQTREAQKASEENDRKIEDLREKYNRATSQAEKDSLREQMTDADRDFLANQNLAEGRKLHYARNYDGAIKLYNESIKLNSKFSEAYNSRGISYYYMGQYERAIQDFDKAIYLDTNNYHAYCNRGTAYGKDLQKYDKAFNDFNVAIKINPNYYDAYLGRGVVYYYFKQYENAIQDYIKTIQLKPNYAMAYNNLGIIQSNLKQYEQAIQNYNKAILLKPDLDLAYNNRAVAYFMLKNFKQAFDDTNKAIQLNPIYANPYYVRGLCYQKFGDNKKAQADFAKAKELGYNG